MPCEYRLDRRFCEYLQLPYYVTLGLSLSIKTVDDNLTREGSLSLTM